VKAIEVWFAAYRITRLGVKDSIFRVPRNRLIGWAYPQARTKARAAYTSREKTPFDSGNFIADEDFTPFVPDVAPGVGKAASIVACVYCFGVYAGFVADWIPGWLRRGLAAAGFSALMYDLQKAISR